MDRAIVSFANGTGRYRENLARLEESLVGRFDGDFLGFIGEESIGSPLHINVPYGFKVVCIQHAIEAGYTSVLWLDSSCFAVADLSPIFESIERDGFIFQEAGHYLGTWSTDAQLNYWGISRDEAMKVGMIGNAGMLGFDFTHPAAQAFFIAWEKSMRDGMFKGSWTNTNGECSADDRCKGSRHDMSNSSALVYLMGLGHLAKRGDEWLEYAAPGSERKNETILIQAQG